MFKVVFREKTATYITVFSFILIDRNNVLTAFILLVNVWLLGF